MRQEEKKIDRESQVESRKWKTPCPLHKVIEGRGEKIEGPARSVSGPYVFKTVPVGSASQAERLGSIF